MNDLSIHGQFHTAGEFFGAVEKLMEIRREIKRVGSELFCHRGMATTQVTAHVTMPQAIQGMPLEKQRAWIQWLTRLGPYWMDVRQHGEDEWLETGEEQIVTDTAIGEAAFCRMHDLDRELVSADPSNWLHNPITVTWKKADGFQQAVDVQNHWSLETVSQSLDASPPGFNSWRSLEQHVRQACDNLTFSDDAFDPFDGYSYAPGAAERVRILLDVLNRLRGGFDEDGNRTTEFESLYSNYFARKEARFTDSSDTDKNDFESKLTFPHPDKPGEYLFCSWHGKVKSPQIRIHFSWPISADIPLYVVYVGPKITKH